MVVEEDGDDNDDIVLHNGNIGLKFICTIYFSLENCDSLISYGKTARVLR